MCFNNCQPYVHVRFHDQFVMWYQNSYMWCAGFFGVGLGLSFGPRGILWSCKYWAWWRSWAVAVFGIPSNSDFGTSNKIGTEEGTWSEVLIFGRGMDDKNVGVWYLCCLASKNLIWGCHYKVVENCALPGYYSVSSGNFTTNRRAQFLATSR